MSEEKHVLGPKARDYTKDPPYGRLTVIAFAGMNNKGMSLWLCRCECGGEKVVLGSKLKAGEVSSCGCKRFDRREDLTGMQFDRWKVLSYAGKHKDKHSLWLCQCSCGSPPKKIPAGNLTRKMSRSCGCLKKETAGVQSVTHGQMKGRRPTPVYRAWHKAKARCFDEGDRSYPEYGGRGITMCQRWRDSFEPFLDDMGQRPPGRYSLGRKDNLANYSCGKCDECVAHGWTANVRWETDTQQARNKRNNRVIVFGGQAMCLAELSEKVGIGQSVIRRRLKRGWPLEKATSLPPRKSRR